MPTVIGVQRENIAVGPGQCYTRTVHGANGARVHVRADGVTGWYNEPHRWTTRIIHNKLRAIHSMEFWACVTIALCVLALVTEDMRILLVSSVLSVSILLNELWKVLCRRPLSISHGRGTTQVYGVVGSTIHGQVKVNMYT